MVMLRPTGNYFVGSAGSIGWAIPDGGIWLAAHMSLGLALSVGGLAVIILAVRAGGRVTIGTAVLGAVGTALTAASHARKRILEREAREGVESRQKPYRAQRR